MTDAETAILKLYLSIMSGARIEATAPEDAAKLALPFNELAMDSLDRVDLVMQVERSFGITLDEGQVLRCENLSELASLAQSLA